MARPAGQGSGRVTVLVDESVEQVDAFDAPDLCHARRRRHALNRGRYVEAYAAVWAARVVVRHVLGKNLLQVAPVPDQYPDGYRSVGAGVRYCR